MYRGLKNKDTKQAMRVCSCCTHEYPHCESNEVMLLKSNFQKLYVYWWTYNHRIPDRPSAHPQNKYDTFNTDLFFRFGKVILVVQYSLHSLIKIDRQKTSAYTINTTHECIHRFS